MTVGTKKRSALYWLTLLLYGLFLSGLLLYVRYPAEKVEGYLARKIAGITPGISLVIGACGYSFPLQLFCDRVILAESEKKTELAVFENITFSPVFAGLTLNVQMTGDFAGGTFQSVAGFSPLTWKGTVRQLELTNVDLGRVTFVQNAFQREISGILNFRGSAVGSIKETDDIEVEGKISVQKGDFRLRQPILLIGRVQMAPLDLDVLYKKGVLKLQDGRLRGTELTGDFSGELKAGNAIAEWELAMQGSLTPSQEYVAANPQVQRVVKRLQRQYGNDGIPYRVSGNLAVPRFRFGSQ